MWLYYIKCGSQLNASKCIPVKQREHKIESQAIITKWPLLASNLDVIVAAPKNCHTINGRCIKFNYSYLIV
jgi:hypothetical protein